MRGSVSIRAVFPDIFIKPPLYALNSRKSADWKNLLTDFRRYNIVITGNAGAGKTTLLKYIYLYNNKKNDILYLPASSLLKTQCGDYELVIKSILNRNLLVGKHILIFIDGIDEAFNDRTEELDKLIDSFNYLDKVNVWLGWRKEHYYNYKDDSDSQLFRDVIELEAWNSDMALNFAEIYGKKTKQPNIFEKAKEIINKDNEEIQNLIQTPFNVTLLIYLIEKDPKLLSDNQTNRLYNTYCLYETFFHCWCKEEKKRGTSFLEEKDIKEILWEIAEKTYFGCDCIVETKDTAVVDLIQFDAVSVSLGIRNTVGFYHRSFCAFFRAYKILNSLVSENKEFVRALSKPLKNDITDFVKCGILILEVETKDKILKTLINCYYQICNSLENYVSKEIKEELVHLDNMAIFYLKNEIVYLVTRFPETSVQITEFVRFVNEQETDRFMRLDIAYGAVLTGPYELALEYAKKLHPGTEEDITNRSWTVVYFGDVHGVAYEYKDDKKVPWTKARNARLKRLQSDQVKAVRFRILDLPLLYCFYESREWSDLSYEDLTIIKNADINSPDYSEDEKAFLKEEKEKLVNTYEKHLFSKNK